MRTSARLPLVDGLRAISIALVLMGHVAITLGSEYRSANAWRLFRAIMLGHFGVTIFFVISGFLITSILLNEINASGEISLRRFYFRRTLRIFPAFYFLMLVTIGMRVAGLCHISGQNLWASATYTSNYFGASGLDFQYLGHTWSLSVEEQFYLVWPAILLVFGTRRGLVVAAAMLAVCPLLRLWGCYTTQSVLFYQSHYVADSLASGALLAGFRDRLHAHNLYDTFIHSKFSILIPAATLALAELVTHERLFNPYLYTSVGGLAINLGIAFTLDWLLTAPPRIIAAGLSLRGVQWLGIASYSVYLWQQMFLYSPLLSELPIWPRVLAGLLLTFLAASLSYYFIERKALALRSYLEPKLFRKCQRPISTAAANAR